MSPSTIPHQPARDAQFEREVTAIASALERQLQPGPTTPSRTLSIAADDGVTIVGDLFLPRGPARARLHVRRPAQIVAVWDYLGCLPQPIRRLFLP